MKSCDVCNKQSLPLYCSRCKCGRYCSKICQTKNWSVHKITCRVITECDKPEEGGIIMGRGMSSNIINYTTSQNASKELLKNKVIEAQSIYCQMGINIIVEIMSYFNGFTKVIAVYNKESINFFIPDINIDDESVVITVLNVAPEFDVDDSHIDYDVGLLIDDDVGHGTISIKMTGKRFDSQIFRRSLIQLRWLKDYLVDTLLIYNHKTRSWKVHRYK